MALEPPFKEEFVPTIVDFIRHHVAAAGRSGAVLGLSGGVDSAVVAALCARALGPEGVLTLFLRDEVAQEADARDARAVAERLGVAHEVVDIQPAVDRFLQLLHPDDRVRSGNIRARVRMIVLYDRAASLNRVVMGTGNKSELACGYWTKFGDGGVDFQPVGDLYKTQVWALARHLGLPETLVSKVPSAGLWQGQTDEQELGLLYRDLDRILLGVELRLPAQEIAAKTGLPLEQVRRVEARVAANVHKRKMPLVPRCGIRTFGLDWRE